MRLYFNIMVSCTLAKTTSKWQWTVDSRADGRKQVSLWLVGECQGARVTRMWLTSEKYF